MWISRSAALRCAPSSSSSSSSVDCGGSLLAHASDHGCAPPLSSLHRTRSPRPRPRPRSVRCAPPPASFDRLRISRPAAVCCGGCCSAFADGSLSRSSPAGGVAAGRPRARPFSSDPVLAGGKDERVDAAGALQQQQQQRQRDQLRSRVLFGLAIGVGVLGAVLSGGWVFTVALSGASLIATEEYFGLVAGHGSMAPPPAFVTKVCSAICAGLPLLTLYFGGRAGVAFTTAASILAIVLLLQRQKPRFSQLSSVIFGLFYCGYLPSFWVKLRCCLTVPGLNTGLVAGWPVLLGGRIHWTVGLLATFISFSCVIAADTGAFIGGKFFGKTPLSHLSPKKTFEGAGVGLIAAVAVSVLLARLFQWPSSLISAAVLGVLIFFASFFGDLLESMIKRDVGVKDSGRLIPGHGGVLDRSDSYIFTGALVYFFVKFVLRSYGL